MEPVTASRNIRLLPDVRWEKLDLLSFDILILPGGASGTDILCKHDGVQEALRIFNIEEKWIAAICAAPLALHRAGVLKNRAFTCYPGIEKEIHRTDRSDDAIVIDRNIITSQGPGTAIPFALKLIELLECFAAMDKIRSGLLY
jgi:4-methyl-5(b-hydroxyethyl)-thiazole monophosphate biosynthesis